ncbi:hypothetical protein ANN_20759, partial [Periplaneta americana]
MKHQILRLGYYSNRHHLLSWRRISSIASSPKICIVGSGPASFYAAQHLIKTLPQSEVDIYEQLPVPFGLVRFGVAPDHPEVKNVINTFTKTASSPNLRFVGNVSLGQDVTLQELKNAYHAVLLAYGADEDREFGLEGESLGNVLSARRFVGWYNGLPRDKNFSVNLDVEEVVILGQGNVALDVARILLTPIDKLKSTDITAHALDALSRSRVRCVRLIGRRGPLQVAFTIKELREMLKLPGCVTVCNQQDFESVRSVIPDRDIDNKISKFRWICGTINRTLKNKTRKETKLKFYKTMAVPVLTYGSESWIIKERDKSKLQAAEMRFLRRVKGCTRRDLIRNEDIRKELDIYNINEKVEDYKEKWKEHLSRMDNERIPALIQQYQPKGKRDFGQLERPRRRLTELLCTAAESSPSGPVDENLKQFHLMFYRSPLSFHPSSGAPHMVGSVKLGVNQLDHKQQAVPTGTTETVPCGLILRSIGYRSTQADPDVPFDSGRGHVLNTKGVVQP